MASRNLRSPLSSLESDPVLSGSPLLAEASSIASAAAIYTQSQTETPPSQRLSPGIVGTMSSDSSWTIMCGQPDIVSLAPTSSSFSTVYTQASPTACSPSTATNPNNTNQSVLVAAPHTASLPSVYTQASHTASGPHTAVNPTNTVQGVVAATTNPSHVVNIDNGGVSRRISLPSQDTEWFESKYEDDSKAGGESDNHLVCQESNSARQQQISFYQYDGVDDCNAILFYRDNRRQDSDVILVERDMDDDVIIIEDDPVQPEIDSAGDSAMIEEDEGALDVDPLSTSASRASSDASTITLPPSPPSPHRLPPPHHDMNDGQETKVNSLLLQFLPPRPAPPVLHHQQFDHKEDRHEADGKMIEDTGDSRNRLEADEKKMNEDTGDSRNSSSYASRLYNTG